MMRLPKRAFFAVCLAVAIPALLAAGCGGASKTNTFTALMKLVPAAAGINEAGVLFTLTDHAALYKKYGIIFTDFTDLMTKAQEQGLSLTLLNGPDITGYGRNALDTPIQTQYVGYNVAATDADIEFGIPPSDGVAAIGHYDPQAMTAALQNQGDWPDWAKAAYAAETYRGVTIHTWGDGMVTHLTSRNVPPHIDNLGRARPLAVTDRNLYYTGSLDLLKACIDAAQGKAQSLADLSEYAVIAAELGDKGVFTALLGPEATVRPAMDAGSGPKLKKFITFGSGQGQDEKGIFTLLLLYHENAADASANVALLKEQLQTTTDSQGKPWSSRITSYDIKSAGKLLTARLYTTVNFYEIAAYNQYSLLAHEY